MPLRVIALYNLYLSVYRREIKFLEALCELGFSPYLQDELRTLLNQSKKILFVISEPLLEYGTIQNNTKIQKSAKKNC